jgi:hypothetical protein
MDIRKPNPIRDWREFLKEVGIIVLGVCIALAAEQAVETWHKHERASEARDSIHAEIARNLNYMGLRSANEPCVSRRLDEVDGLIAASTAGKLPPDPIWIGQALGLIMHNGKYKAATQSGSVSLFSSEEQGIYTDLYAMFDTYWEQAILERAAWSDLRTLEKHPPPTAILDWQLRSAVQKARAARWSIELTRTVAIQDAALIGVKPATQANPVKLSVCLPLHTPRAEALKLAAQPGFNLDEP